MHAHSSTVGWAVSKYSTTLCVITTSQYLDMNLDIYAWELHIASHEKSAGGDLTVYFAVYKKACWLGRVEIQYNYLFMSGQCLDMNWAGG